MLLVEKQISHQFEHISLKEISLTLVSKATISDLVDGISLSLPSLSALHVCFQVVCGEMPGILLQEQERAPSEGEDCKKGAVPEMAQVGDAADEEGRREDQEGGAGSLTPSPGPAEGGEGSSKAGSWQSGTSDSGERERER